MYYKQAATKNEMELFQIYHPYIESKVIDAFHWDDRLIKIYFNDSRIFYYDTYENYSILNVDKNEAITLEKQKRIFSKLLEWSLMRKFIPHYKIAEDLGLSRITISRYLHQKSIPDFITFEKIVRYLHVEPEAFMDAINE